MASFQQYAVLFYVEEFGHRQLATFTTLRKQTDFIHFMEDNESVLDGQWYKFTEEAAFRRAIKKARESGGIVYDLPNETTASFQQYAVLFYLQGFEGRQLATVTTLRKQTDLIYFMEDNESVLDGQWYKFMEEAAFHRAIKKARESGGIVYDLPVRTLNY